MPKFPFLNRNDQPQPPANNKTGNDEHQEPFEDVDRPLEERLAWIRMQLTDNSDVAYHTFVAGPMIPCAIVYLRGMVDLKVLQEDVLKVLFRMDAADADEFRMQLFDRKQLSISDFRWLSTLSDGIASVLDSKVILLVDGEHTIIELPMAKHEKRAIDEPPNEPGIRGPREAFIEDLSTNLTLIRRRLKTSKFKTENMRVGALSKTRVVIAYIDGLCKPELLEEVKYRLSKIEIDGVLGSSVVEEYLDDTPFSPFPQLQYTERPDIMAAALLEGRVAIIVDGSPIALIAPVTLMMLLQSSEDYYQRFVASTWIRWIRYVFLFVSLLLPSTYVAITTFHPEIIPSKLLLTVMSSREIVPFPALIEAFIMEISFEALREAAIRIPKSIGQAVSIIGALIIGTAAVEAGIVSAAMVIIVSLTGIASFISPHYDLGLSFRLLRFPIMILAGLFGLFGIACSLLFLYIHLINLRSFGVAYLSPITPFVPSDLKDTLVRAPWWLMNKRPKPSSTKNEMRQRKTGRKWSYSEEESED
ncbi:spore germination protein [Paenibacillus sp. H1-7]|uniref:spore germination protein n=1 Tax=Paenibacillus sp. H1-7 TaxID=2282849 RepID=UPI001EF9AAFB|nr:spore germination protein [Paenibacillus sp. H1-7]ULL18557.1 spore germination protein [Paenibacillus sp. H1-7]